MTMAPGSRDGIGRPLVAAGAILILCALGIAAWTAQAPLASAVLAEGRIVVEGDRKTIQHLEGGIVSEILVTDGQSVGIGDPLVRLDATELLSERASLIAERDFNAARELRLRAELEDVPPDFSTLASSDPDSLATAIASQRALHAARAEERAAQDGMIEGALARLAAGTESIEAELNGIEAQFALVEEDALAARELSERGVLSRAALRDRERDFAGIGGARAALLARREEGRAAEAEMRLQHAENRTQRIAAISQELAEVTARLAEVTPALNAVDERLRRAELRAPVAGIVVGLNVATIDGVIAPGEPIMDIVPSGAILVAEAELRPSDRERLQAGMTGEIRLPGIEGRRDLSLSGVISRISADRIEATDPEGEGGHYDLTLALDGGAGGADLAPGMPVTIVVPTQARTVVDYLLGPIRDAVARSMREV